MNTNIHGEPQLSAHTICPADQHGINKVSGFEIENPAKTTDLNVCAGPGGGAYKRFDCIYQRIPSIN